MSRTSREQRRGCLLYTSSSSFFFSSSVVAGEGLSLLVLVSCFFFSSSPAASSECKMCIRDRISTGQHHCGHDGGIGNRSVQRRRNPAPVGCRHHLPGDGQAVSYTHLDVYKRQPLFQSTHSLRSATEADIKIRAYIDRFNPRTPCGVRRTCPPEQ